MLKTRGIEGIRVLQALLSLGARHPCTTLEEACQTALSYDVFRLKTLPTQRWTFTLEQFDLAVNGEHFLHKGTAEVQEPEEEGTLILRLQGHARCLEEGCQVGPEFDEAGWLPAAGGSRFQQYPGSAFARAAESMYVGKPVGAPEAADRLAFSALKGKGGMCNDRISQLLEFSIDAFLAQGRVEGERVGEKGSSG